jgi:ATP-dependent DNA ligase
MAASQTKAAFVEPMLLLRTDKLPEGWKWQYEIKLDGFRSIAFKSAGRVHLPAPARQPFTITCST